MPKVRERKSISQSGTRRRCNSKLATESRLMFQPLSWSFAARSCCDQPFLLRHFLTWGPIKFSGTLFTVAHSSHGREIGCVDTHTIFKRAQNGARKRGKRR